MQKTRPTPKTLPEWLALIVEVIPRIPGGGRFGERKVWIHAVRLYVAASLSPRDGAKFLDDFASLMCLLQQENLIQMHRADMFLGFYENDFMQVKSEIAHPAGKATFHFLEIPT